MSMARRDKELFERDIDAYSAASALLSVIRCYNPHEGLRTDLLHSHFQLVYYFAHRENELISFQGANPKISRMIAARQQEAC